MVPVALFTALWFLRESKKKFHSLDTKKISKGYVCNFLWKLLHIIFLIIFNIDVGYLEK